MQMVQIQQAYLPQELVMTSQQFEEQFQKTCGVDKIFVPQENQGFAEGL